MKNHRGNTLPELMVSLLILSLLGKLGIEGMHYMLQRQQASVAISRLLIATYTARAHALSHRRTTTLCPTLDDKECSGSWNGKLMLFMSNFHDPSQKTIIATYPAMAHGQTRWQSFRGEKMLQMASTGQTLAMNGTFVYCPGNKDLRYARALIISKAGRARVATDLNNDGIVDLRRGEPVQCV